MIGSGKRAQQMTVENKGKTLIFVYGTLMHSRSRDLALHHKENAYRSSISGYKKLSYSTPEGNDYETIETDGKNGRDIEGDVMGVWEGDLANLKKWEDQYHLIPVKLDNGQRAYAFQLNRKDKIKKE